MALVLVKVCEEAAAARGGFDPTGSARAPVAGPPDGGLSCLLQRRPHAAGTVTVRFIPLATVPEAATAPRRLWRQDRLPLHCCLCLVARLQHGPQGLGPMADDSADVAAAHRAGARGGTGRHLFRPSR